MLFIVKKNWHFCDVTVTSLKAMNVTCVTNKPPYCGNTLGPKCELKRSLKMMRTGAANAFVGLNPIYFADPL